MAFAQTPRAFPGAFYVTPAVPRTQTAAAPGADPTRRRLFTDVDGGTGAPASASAVAAASAAAAGAGTDQGAAVFRGPPSSMKQQQHQQHQHQQRQLEPLSPVAKAARAIAQFLQADEHFPELDSYCRQGSSSDYDFAALDTAWAPFLKTQMYPIPNQIFDFYNAGRLQTLMGLFAEINHAWVAIDNALFLWDYTNPEPEMIGFEDQPHTIQAVALVPPRKGIFIDAITHVLVVATSNEMIVLGVQTGAGQPGTAPAAAPGQGSVGAPAAAVSLYQTNVSMALSGHDVRVIAGTANGRIFYGGGAEIDLHELYYHKEDSWFRARCGKINHTSPGWLSAKAQSFLNSKPAEGLVDIVIDDTRGLVYTLSSRSTIRTYHIEDPNQVTKVIEKEKYHCLRDITHMIHPSPLLTDRMSIVSISPITAPESGRLHLMALTNTGCRLFLSATSAASFMTTSSDPLRPQSMQVQFIKFPPPTRPGAGAEGGAVDAGSRALDVSRFGRRFAPGYFLDFVCKDGFPNEDLLFVAAPETGRIKASPAGAAALRYHEHANWIDIGSRAEAVGLITKPFAAAAQPLGFGNELAVQFDEPPSEFAILTNTGVHVVRRRRLVDVFAASMRAVAGDEALELEARRFTQTYGRVETVSTALAVACGHGTDGRIAAATRAIDQPTRDRARVVFVEFGGNPTFAEGDGGGGALGGAAAAAAAVTTDMVRLSSRHDGLCLYLARTVRVLWRSTVIAVTTSPNGGVAIASAVPTAKLRSVQENLDRLRRFLDSNRGLIQGLSGHGQPNHAPAGSRHEEVALQAEHQALHALERLMESISEGISFVLMLFDERVADIYARLDDDDTRRRFRELTYERLFAQPAGRELAKFLVRAVVKRNIESGSNVETVADALRRRCGSFCSPDDVVTFRAQEQLQRASEQEMNSNLARTMLLESLRLFEQVAGSLTHDNLRVAVAQYMERHYFAGAIQLCLAAARERDRGNGALAWKREGRPSGADPRERLWVERRQCYDLVHEVLVSLEAATASEPEYADGRPTLAATKRLEAYEIVNGSDDEVFHYDLYEWYVDQGWTDRILAVDSPHVVAFLQELASGSVEHAELLCRFYTHRNRFFDAATVQLAVANSDFAIGIKDRITLLSRAKGNANVQTVGVGRQEQQQLGHDVSDLLEVAHIQDDLLERLQADNRCDSEQLARVTTALDGPILNLTDLFNEYADQANYYDICIVIYHAADHRNAATIATTWRNMIQTLHDDVSERRAAAQAATNSSSTDLPLPYESVSSRIQAVAHRISLDSFVFPIPTILPELCRYSVAHRQDNRVGADPCWPIHLFLALGVSHDTIARVLDDLFDTQELGFTGQARYRVIEWIVYIVEAWIAELRRRGGGGVSGGVGSRMSFGVSMSTGSLGGAGFGIGAAAGPAQWVVDLVRRCEESLPPPGQGANPGGCELPELRRRVRTARRDVEALLSRAAGGGMMGSTIRF